MQGEKESHPDLRTLYIDLLRDSLTHSLWIPSEPRRKNALIDALRNAAPSLFGYPKSNADDHEEGRGWPELAHTMIGLRRMDNLRHCVETVIRDGVQGDLIETGVWRGGACIFMRGILKAYECTDRRVWVADSFAGLPPPDPARAPADKDDKHHRYNELAVSLEQVQENFRAYGLLDDQVQFLKGWFKDTLPNTTIERLAVCRLDGDMYESTDDALRSLYHKLQPGGFLIVDDYGAVPACRQAVEDFRGAHGITDPIQTIDWTGIYWRKGG
jgi:O-methyltransferase